MINSEFCLPEKYNISYKYNVLSHKDITDDVITPKKLYTSYLNKALVISVQY